MRIKDAQVAAELARQLGEIRRARENIAEKSIREVEIKTLGHTRPVFIHPTCVQVHGLLDNMETQVIHELTKLGVTDYETE